jgi:predicted MFS family arabinose efflux permease
MGLAGAWYFSRIQGADLTARETKRFVFRGRYRYFYALNILFGARKLLFLVFAPWLLIKNHGCRPETIATLTLIAAGLSYYFRQALGKLVDTWGERNVFLLDAATLIVICFIFATLTNIWVLYTAFIIENLMFAMRIARTTYLKKIALHESDITPTISLGITMDHVISMTTPALGGLLWVHLGYASVFWASMSLAVFSFLVARHIPANLGKTTTVPQGQ